MDAIEQCTNALLEAIKASEEYHKFEHYRAELQKQPELQQQINDFRKRVYLLQNTDQAVDLQAEMNNLFEEREELHENALASGYLASELHMCRILQRISIEVLGVAEMDLDTFEDKILV